MNFKQRLAAKADKLKTELTAIYYASKDPKTCMLSRILVFVAIGYALSPIDLIPDFIPIIGYLDDLVILPLLIAAALKSIPKDVMARARDKAKENPIILKKNWIIGALFLIFWAFMVLLIIKSILV